ncbi:TatD family hydrolase [Halobacillus massiliensis]|uniref:TatD family hydrolase n=1 Tax=Halobacillus massiliensis TaxID=1926286 RepID=UPI0009E1F375|nr:TatD family hydrolase [Halobacillus massiliensis]
MKFPIIDAHIHFDMYEKHERQQIIEDLLKEKIEAMISVSNNYTSAVENLRLNKTYPQIKPAAGYHPEQPLPSKKETADIVDLIFKEKDNFYAIGEVGLPYYLRKKGKVSNLKEYINMLETYIDLAKQLDKPIICHAVYEDANIVLDLLKKHSVEKAHFHWFKGSDHTLEQIRKAGYFISVTPDSCYEKEIQHIVSKFPLEYLMVETDGPWPFKGEFEKELTHPRMIHESIQIISNIKQLEPSDVYNRLLKNTKKFYQC